MRGRRLARLCSGTGLLLALAGACAVGLGASREGGRTVAAAVVVEPSPAPVPSGGPTRVPAPLPRSEPVALEIPAIDVDTAVFPIGLNAEGGIAVPEPGPRYDLAAWYRYSPTPGERGPSVIEGHLDSVAGPSVFHRLGSLRPGQEIRVERADGLTAVFGVTEVRGFPQAEFPTAAVYGDLDYPGLRLITCGGALDSVTRRYLDNLVVFAAFRSAHPTR